jgi:hypothetical protein
VKEREGWKKRKEGKEGEVLPSLLSFPFFPSSLPSILPINP